MLCQIHGEEVTARRAQERRLGELHRPLDNRPGIVSSKASRLLSKLPCPCSRQTLKSCSSSITSKSPPISAPSSKDRTIWLIQGLSSLPITGTKRTTIAFIARPTYARPRTARKHNVRAHVKQPAVRLIEGVRYSTRCYPLCNRCSRPRSKRLSPQSCRQQVPITSACCSSVFSNF